MLSDTGDELRAQSWDEYQGQMALKQRLTTRINAAVNDGRMLDHVLLAAGPGQGKTSLARIIAAQLGDDFVSMTMPVRPNALVQLLRSWEGGVLFLDEIHRASQSQQEDLLTLLEDGYLQLPNGRRLHHDSITVIAATTEPERLIGPLFDRFPIRPIFEDYSQGDMELIVSGMLARFGLCLDDSTVSALAKASGGVPRQARQFAIAARDLQSVGEPTDLHGILNLCGVDHNGLTQEHFAYLKAVDQLGGVAGLEKIVGMTRMHKETVGNLERFLLRNNMIQYTSAGRELTTEGFAQVHPQQSAPHRRTFALAN